MPGLGQFGLVLADSCLVIGGSTIHRLHPHGADEALRHQTAVGLHLVALLAERTRGSADLPLQGCRFLLRFAHLLFDQPLLLKQRLPAGDEQRLFALQDFGHLRVAFGTGQQFARESELCGQRAVCR